MIKIATWNACLGITNKLDLISEYLKNENTNILCIQEGEIDLLNINFYDIENYTFIHSNCPIKSRSCIYVHNSLNFTRLINYENPNIELICLEFEHFILINYYRTFKPVNNISLQNHFKETINLVDEISKIKPNKFTIFLGDFNLDYKKVNDPSYVNSTFFSTIDPFLINYGFIQIVKNSTWRRVVNGLLKESILDHIYVNDVTKIKNLNHFNMHVGDHDLLQFETDLVSTKPGKKTFFLRD